MPLLTAGKVESSSFFYLLFLIKIETFVMYCCSEFPELLNSIILNLAFFTGVPVFFCDLNRGPSNLHLKFVFQSWSCLGFQHFEVVGVTNLVPIQIQLKSAFIRIWIYFKD